MNIPYKKIGIAGAGGLGSHLVRLLWDFGYNRKQFDFLNTDITVFDDDYVDDKNLLHQNFTIDDLGKLKVDVLADQYAIIPEKRFMTEEDFDNFDIVFSCVDGMELRNKLYTHVSEKLFWIDGRSTSNVGMLFNSKVPKSIRDKYLTDSTERAGCLLQHEKDGNLSHATPILVAAGMLQIFLQAIRGNFIKVEKTITL